MSARYFYNYKNCPIKVAIHTFMCVHMCSFVSSNMCVCVGGGGACVFTCVYVRGTPNILRDNATQNDNNE